MNDGLKQDFERILAQIKENPRHIHRWRERQRQRRLKAMGLTQQQYDQLTPEERRERWKQLPRSDHPGTLPEEIVFGDDEFITVSVDFASPYWGSDTIPPGWKPSPLEARRKGHLQHKHRHDFFEMAYLYSGDCYCGMGDTEYKMEPGTIWLYNTQASHSICVADENTNLINILIRKSTFDTTLLPMIKSNDLFLNFFLNSIYNDSEEPICMRFQVEEGSTLQEKLFGIVDEYVREDPYSQSIMQFFFCAALMELSRQYRNIIRTDVTEKDGLSVEQIVTYISDHCSTVTLQSTAEHFHYSTAYISRLISQRTNKTFSGWLTEFKVQKASALLKSTDLELERIAQMVGYMERRSFEKAFKQHMGITPSQYRKQCRSSVYSG